MTEKEKMLQGKIYDGQDSELLLLRIRGHELSLKYNRTHEWQQRKRQKLTDKIMPNHGKNCYLQGPIMFDYGVFTTVGDNFYANFNLTVLDTCPINIGDNVFFGPNCTLATPVHPFVATERNLQVKNGHLTDDEYAKPIVIGSNCWIASNVVVCGGVTIGQGCVIGAGSVVTRDIPPNSFAVGNPCKVVRPITEQDSILLKKQLW